MEAFQVAGVLVTVFAPRASAFSKAGLRASLDAIPDVAQSTADARPRHQVDAGQITHRDVAAVPAPAVYLVVHLDAKGV